MLDSMTMIRMLSLLLVEASNQATRNCITLCVHWGMLVRLHALISCSRRLMTQMLTLELLCTAQTVVGTITLLRIAGTCKEVLVWTNRSTTSKHIQHRPFSGNQKYQNKPRAPASGVKNALGERMLTKRPASDNTFTCYRCGEQGHTVRNCPKKAKTSTNRKIAGKGWRKGCFRFLHCFLSL